MKNFQKRIEYSGEMDVLLKDVCNSYGLKPYIFHEVLEIGYEDFNLILNTSDEKYFVKVFASYRTVEEITRYLDIMTKAIAHNINHPLIYKQIDESLLYTNSFDGEKVSLVVLEYIPYKSLYQSQEKLEVADVKYLAREAAKICQMEIEPLEVYDAWSVVNISNEFPKIKERIPEEYKSMVFNTFDDVQKNLTFNALPYAFVHGDLTRSNLIKDGNSIRILDFSVSNINPRIQDLAILFCDTIFDLERLEWSKEMYKVMIDEYQKIQPLELIEITKLPLYIKAGFLTNIIGTILNEDSEVEVSENNYWKQIGFKGLTFSV